MRIIRRKRNPKNREIIEKRQSNNEKSENRVGLSLSKDINENLSKFKAFLEESSDMVFRRFKLGIGDTPVP